MGIVKSYRKEISRKTSGRWDNNVIIDLKEVDFSRRNYIYSAKDSDYWKALPNAA